MNCADTKKIVLKTKTFCCGLLSWLSKKGRMLLFGGALCAA
jgi:hypothetical protein